MIIESLWGKIVLITDVWGKIGQGGANALRATDAIVYGVEIPFRISRDTAWNKEIDPPMAATANKRDKGMMYSQMLAAAQVH